MKTTKTIALDWLQVAYNGSAPTFSEQEGAQYKEISDEITVKRSHRYSQEFEHTCEIIYKGEPFAYLESHPKKSAINPALINITVKNHRLYSIGYISMLDDVTTKLGLTYQYVKKIDIAIDQSMKHKKRKLTYLNKLTEAIVTQEVKGVGRARFKPMYDSSFTLEGFHYGSKQSDKFVRGYYKHLELNSSKKQYIQEFWDLNKLNSTLGVERIEMSIKKRELKKYLDFDKKDLYLLESKACLASLFKSAASGFFEFVDRKEYTRKHKKVDRCKKLYTVSYYGFSALLLEKAKAVAIDQLARLKMATKTIFMIAKKTKNKLYSLLAEEIAENINLSEWYEEKRDFWSSELDGWINNQHSNYLTRYEAVEHGEYYQYSIDK